MLGPAMESHGAEWAAYIIAAVLARCWKALTWLRSNRSRKRLHRQIADYIFHTAQTDGMSSLASVGGVWILGAAYIHHWDVPGAGFLTSVPLHASIAFTLGASGEAIVPYLVRSLLGRFKGKNEKEDPLP